MTATERRVMESVNAEFQAAGLPLPFKEVGVTRSGPSRTIELRESAETWDQREARLLRELRENRETHLREVMSDPKAARQLTKQLDEAYDDSMKRLAEIFMGEGKENKRARKAFREGRAG